MILSWDAQNQMASRMRPVCRELLAFICKIIKKLTSHLCVIFQAKALHDNSLPEFSTRI
jgi:hypothetical protein